MARKAASSLVNTNPMRRLSKALSQINATSGHPRIRLMYKNWAGIYRGFVHRRYLNHSNGAGDWPRLRPRTIKRKGHSLILIHTRTLINAVDPNIYNAPGAYARLEGNQFVVGYGGSVIHPTSRSGGRNFTIEEIASFHQAGDGNNLPQRRIIVGPDKNTVNLVTAEINSAIRDILAEASV